MIQFNELDINKSPEGLIPAIIQDERTLQVLMLGYMNEEAFLKTQKEGIVTFFSRSRQKIWTKGETSGNFLKVISISKDCDNDTLLVRVIPTGPVCHTGSDNCFNTRVDEGFIKRLDFLIQERFQMKPQESYTTRLFEKGIHKIAQKVGEEAVETVIEAIADNDERLIYEASDLIYHLIVLLTAKGYSLKDIEEELYKRHK